MIRLVELRVHPLKSGRAVSVPLASVGPLGLRDDRTWMVVDDSGAFVSQRRDGVLATLDAHVAEDGALHLGREGAAEIRVARPRDDGAVSVRVWGDPVAADDAGDEAAAWLSSVIGRPCRLVRAASRTGRVADATWAGHDHPVAFADGFALLLASRSSLADLEARAGRSIDIGRFRPNLVIDGAVPFAEDDARHVRIGACRFDIVKPCSRCTMIGRDQQTGVADVASESPLATLATYRKHDGQVYFGQNLVWRAGDRLQVGDPVSFD